MGRRVVKEISKKALISWAFFHLILVTMSAFYIKIAPWFPGEHIFTLYQKATGANSGYGFFAPAIGVKTRAVFDVVDEHGVTAKEIPLVPATDREAQIRLGAIFDELSEKVDENEELRKPIAASLAATIFGKYKNATQVVLHVQEYWPKTMEQYRQGERPSWQDYYAARFARSTNELGDERP